MSKPLVKTRVWTDISIYSAEFFVQAIGDEGLCTDYNREECQSVKSCRKNKGARAKNVFGHCNPYIMEIRRDGFRIEKEAEWVQAKHIKRR